MNTGKSSPEVVKVKSAIKTSHETEMVRRKQQKPSDYESPHTKPKVVKLLPALFKSLGLLPSIYLIKLKPYSKLYRITAAQNLPLPYVEPLKKS